MNPITKKLLEITVKNDAGSIDPEDPSMMDSNEESNIETFQDTNLEIMNDSIKESDKSYTYVGKDGELCRLQPGEDFIDPYIPEANPNNALTLDDEESVVDAFLKKYEKGAEPIQVLRMDLISIIKDMKWIIESGNQNEQWAINFADALNEISIMI